jgi:hypothetical protein
MKKSQPAAGDLAAEKKSDVEFHVGLFERAAFHVVNHAQRAADALRGLEQGGRIGQPLALAGLGVLDAFVEDAEHGLRQRQIAGGGERHDALARILEDVELAESRDVVETRIGAGVADHHQALTDENAAAIGHRVAPWPRVYSEGVRSAPTASRERGRPPPHPW